MYYFEFYNFFFFFLFDYASVGKCVLWSHVHKNLYFCKRTMITLGIRTPFAGSLCRGTGSWTRRAATAQRCPPHLSLEAQVLGCQISAGLLLLPGLKYCIYISPMISVQCTFNREGQEYCNRCNYRTAVLLNVFAELLRFPDKGNVLAYLSCPLLSPLNRDLLGMYLSLA